MAAALGDLFGLNSFDIYRDGDNSSLHTDYVYKFALPWERVDDPVGMTLIFQRYWLHSVTISVVYFALIKAIQKWMEPRPAFALRAPLFYWNLSLALFSVLGFTRFSEDLFHSIWNDGFYTALCYSCEPFGVAAFWAFIFAISKVVELGDTLFIVLRKRPLIFLHYYHHVAVLIYTVHSGAEHTAPGRFFISMNFFAHSCMYSYYAAMACGIKMPRWLPMLVTTIQTAQMLAGVALSVIVYHIKTRYPDLPCQQSMSNLYLAFGIYATFALLFIQFFYSAYINKSKKKGELKKD